MAVLLSDDGTLPLSTGCLTACVWESTAELVPQCRKLLGMLLPRACAGRSRATNLGEGESRMMESAEANAVGPRAHDIILYTQSM